MATYVMLVNYTQKGIENIKESPARLDAVKQAFQAMGGELKQFYLVLGRYDIVVVGEVPDDETAAKLALAVGSGGSVRTASVPREWIPMQSPRRPPAKGRWPIVFDPQGALRSGETEIELFCSFCVSWLVDDSG